MSRTNVPRAPETPTRLSNKATIEQCLQAVNSNSRPIVSLQSQNATLSGSGFPALRAHLAIERPHRVRLQANLMGLGGAELDLGSNDEILWMYTPLARPPAVYFSRHADFAHSRMSRFLPIEPQWLIEALGVVQLDPRGFHQGPYVRREGELEIHSRTPTPRGEVTRVTVLHDKYGWVLRQYLYDSQRRLLASATAKEHRYYEEHDVSLPRRVEIELPSANMKFAVEVSEYYINRMIEDPARMWSPPNNGRQVINVADPRFAPQLAPPPEMRPRRQDSPLEYGSAQRGVYRRSGR